MKKKLSLQDAVQAGQIVYTMNTERGASLAFARSTGLFDEGVDITRNTTLFADAQEHFLWEWRAFVHSAVLHGLSECAPAVVVVEYLRGVQELLKSQDSSFDEALGNHFVDEPFQAYTTVVLEKRLSACPQIFFKRYFNIDLDVAKKSETEMKTAPINILYVPCIASISGAMAMLFAASLDVFEKYEYALD